MALGILRHVLPREKNIQQKTAIFYKIEFKLKNSNPYILQKIEIKTPFPPFRLSQFSQ